VSFEETISANTHLSRYMSFEKEISKTTDVSSAFKLPGRFWNLYGRTILV